MQPADVKTASCPATSGQADGSPGSILQPGPAGSAAGAGDGAEKLHAGWETAWIDLGGEG
jgi:hypothetical protein